MEGDVKCKSADVEGKFNGTIEVNDMLSIRSKASIKGAAVVGKLSVEPGADFSASCAMRSGVKNLSDGPSGEKTA